MGFFNKMQKLAMITGHYICSECGKSMEFEDEWEEYSAKNTRYPFQCFFIHFHCGKQIIS